MSDLSFIVFLMIDLPLYCTCRMVQCPQNGLTWLRGAHSKSYQSGFQSATLGWIKTSLQLTYQISSNIWNANLRTTLAQMNPMVNILDVPREHKLMTLWYKKCHILRELTLMLYNLRYITREMAQHLSERHQPMNPLKKHNKVSGLQKKFYALHHISPTLQCPRYSIWKSQA